MLLSIRDHSLLRAISTDGRLLFATRMVRMAAYGALAVVLALYLAALGLSEAQIGALLSLTLVGDVAISAWIASVTDRIGRRRMLMLGAALMIKLLQRFPILVTLGAALIGYIGGEVVVTDFAIIDWVDANAHWLHWAGPAAGAIFVVAYGGWAARRARERVAAASADLARE